MKKNNAKLTNQLKLLAKSYNLQAGKLDSPLERSVMVIRSVMADPILSSQHLMALGQVLALLNSSNLLTPDFEGILPEGLDNLQQAWLFSEIAARKRGGGRSKSKKASGRRIQSGMPGEPHRFELITESIIEDSMIASDLGSFALEKNDRNSLNLVNAKNIRQSYDDPRAAYPPVNEDVSQLLLKSHEYNWDIFQFAQATNKHSLSVLSNHLFSEGNIFEIFTIPRDKFQSFVRSIEKGYHSDLPYHNSMHATDVLHCLAHLSNMESVNKIVSDIEILAMYLAAIIHG